VGAETDDNNIWQATVTAALLRQGQPIAAVSRMLLAVAILGVLVSIAADFVIWTLPCMASLAAGVLAIWLSLRVSLDAELFEALARAPDLVGFDQAMTALGLVRPHCAGRPLEARTKGALRLLKMQGAALAAQIIFFIAGALVLHWMGQ
jgi:hypothetical protein